MATEAIKQSVTLTIKLWMEGTGGREGVGSAIGKPLGWNENGYGPVFIRSLCSVLTAASSEQLEAEPYH